MKRRSSAWTGIAVLALALAAGLLWLRRPASGPGDWAPAPLATPPGITLQALTKFNPITAEPQQEVYADADGMTLYVRDKNGARDSVCGGDCATTWPPAGATAGAPAAGDWAVVVRADGIRQWAYRGRPLYRAAADSSVGDASGDGAAGGAWHAAVFQPAAGMALPAEVVVRDLAAGGGMGFTDPAGLTLYLFDGDANDTTVPRDWLPLEAPAIASRVGEFAVAARDDGVTQWTWRGKPLFRHEADQAAGDFNGAQVEPRFHVALLVRYFMPADIAIRQIDGLGYLLAKANGATLYAHDRVNPSDAQKAIGAHRGPPATGRALGTQSCDAACTRTWVPFVAASGAAPSGHWQIATRADGTRQWVYKGYALYTRAADPPGEARGHGAHELAPVGDARADELATGRRANAPIRSVAVGGATVGLGLGGLYWHAVAP